MVRQSVAPGVGDLDAEGVAHDVQREPEVPPGDAAVCDGVGRQFGHEVLRRVRRESPGAELLGRQQAGEACSPWCGGQRHAEVADAVVQFGSGIGDFLIHVTQRGGPRLP